MAFRLPSQARESGAGGGLDVLHYEIFQEMANTLARLGRRLEDSLHELRAFDRAPGATRDGGHFSEDGRWQELVAAAGEALWHYVVQREVCGLRDTEQVIHQLDVPREVRGCMGPRLRRGDP